MPSLPSSHPPPLSVLLSCPPQIVPVGGDKKLFGRHFDEKDELVSRISRKSIDATKAYFKEDLSKADWKLMIKLKKLFEII